MRGLVGMFCGVVFLFLAQFAGAIEQSLEVNVHYVVALDPDHQGAQVTIKVDNGRLLKKLQFANDRSVYSAIRANGKLIVNESQVLWMLPKDKAQLTLFVKIPHEKAGGRYDSYINKDWAVFRGDNIIPAMHATWEDGSYAKAELEFVLPKEWNSVETGWPRLSQNSFNIDNPERRFDRPTGWMIAGKIGSRLSTIKHSKIAVVAPMGQGYKRMEVLTFLGFVWREMDKIFGKTPEKLLVVGAGDPMWHGGLSAANSLFLHATRPLVSENGTSPLLHELTHMITRIRGVKNSTANDDWIAEGIAEFYSFEILYRTKGITKARKNKILKDLSVWSKDVTALRETDSSGPITARAVVLINEIDKEIRARTKNKYSFDDVVRKLMEKRKVSLADLKNACENLVAGHLKSLETSLLNDKAANDNSAK